MSQGFTEWRDRLIALYGPCRVCGGPQDTGLRIIICGSRDWLDGKLIHTALDMWATWWHDTGTPLTVIHGDARGADKLADAAARNLGLAVEPHPADWKGKGRGAGPIRNREMLDSGAHLVLAFKEDFDWTLKRGGTENMVRIANEAGITAWVFGATSITPMPGRRVGKDETPTLRAMLADLESA